MLHSTPNRWVMAAAAVVLQFALGSVHAWSVFQRPLSDATVWAKIPRSLWRTRWPPCCWAAPPRSAVWRWRDLARNGSAAATSTSRCLSSASTSPLSFWYRMAIDFSASLVAAVGVVSSVVPRMRRVVPPLRLDITRAAA
jgi:hypothetical protein